MIFFRLFGLNKNPQQGMPMDAPQVPVLGEGGGDDGKQVCDYIELGVFYYFSQLLAVYVL